MTRTTPRPWVIGACVAAAALLGTATLTAAQAAQPSSSDTAAKGSAGLHVQGVPASVDASTGLASQGAGAGSDSIYINSRVKAHGHVFGVLVQTINVPAHDQHIMAVSVTDQTTGWYKSYQTTVAAKDYHWSTTGLNITMPGMTWTGDAKKMSVKATTPWGALDLNYKAQGPELNYAGTGEWQMLGTPQYEFALPAMRTTGTLTAEGRTDKVSGDSWLDRQWGDLPLGPGNHWTWMNISLSNGDKVALWDIVGSTTENAWATVQHRDGSYELVAVKPVADGAGKTWTSPGGNAYPTTWRIEIPSLKAHLNVHLTGTDAQELGEGQMSRLEATATTSGTYQGKKVTGWNYVEMVGAFRA